MRLQVWLAVTAAFAALNFYAASQSSEREGDVVYTYDVLASAVFVYGLLLVVVLALDRGPAAPRAPRPARASFLGSRARPVARRPVAIFAGAAFLLWLSQAGDEQNLTPEAWDSSRAGAYAASFVAIVLIGPVVEELLYRGAGVGLLLHHGRLAAIGVHRADVRPRARPAAVTRRLRLVRNRHGLDPPAHRQPLPGADRAQLLQRLRDDRAAVRLTLDGYSRRVRGAIVLLAGLALAGSADAAPPAVTAAATPAAGVAPVRVTLTAAGDAASYAWSLGDGATAEGAVVTHVYGAGTFVATVTATNAAGEVAQAQVTVTVVGRTVSLEAPRSAGYGEPAVLAGSLRPAVRGARVQVYRGRTYVTSARVGANGRFRDPAPAPLARAVPRALRRGTVGSACDPAAAAHRSVAAGGRARRLEADPAAAARARRRGLGDRARALRRPAGRRPRRLPPAARPAGPGRCVSS